MLDDVFSVASSVADGKLVRGVTKRAISNRVRCATGFNMCVVSARAGSSHLRRNCRLMGFFTAWGVGQSVNVCPGIADKTSKLRGETIGKLLPMRAGDVWHRHISE